MLASQHQGMRSGCSLAEPGYAKRKLFFALQADESRANCRFLTQELRIAYQFRKGQLFRSTDFKRRPPRTKGQPVGLQWFVAMTHIGTKLANSHSIEWVTEQ